MRRLSLSLLALLVPLCACGQSGEETANVVQAATKAVAEGGQQLANKVAELAGTAPEEVKAKLQELLDLAARELKEVKDSEMAQKVAEEVQRVLEQIAELGLKLSEKLDLAGLQQSLAGLIERFKSDPRVVSTLKSLQEKLGSLAH